MIHIRCYFLFFTLLFLIPSVRTQDLPEMLDMLAEKLPEIADDKETIRQTLTFEPEAPYRVAFSQTTTDRKGNSTTRFEFNLAFLEVRNVKRESSRRKMAVQVKAGDDLLKVFEDGTLDTYTDELEILCQDVDQARALEDLLVKAISQAREDFREAGVIPTAYQDLKTYLEEKVSDEVLLDDESYVQTLKPVTDTLSRYTLSQRLITEKGEKESILYTFDFADIHSAGINIQIKRNEVYLEVPCRDKNDFIEAEEEGQVSFDNSLNIYANGYEEARNLLIALQQFTEMSQAQFKENLPDLLDNQAALRYLERHLRAFSFNDMEVKPNATVDCLFDLTIDIMEGEDTERERYVVDLADLAPNTISFDIGSDGIQVIASVRDGANFVRVYEDGEQKNYDDEIPLPVRDVPTAKRLRHALTRSISTCRNEVDLQDFAWIKEALEQGPSDPEQTAKLSAADDAPDCSWVYTLTEQSRRGEKVSRYEFNLSDLNEKSFELQTRGTTASVQVGTNYQERIIAVFDEEEEAEYENEIAFEVADVQAGKTIIASMMQMIAGCKE